MTLAWVIGARGMLGSAIVRDLGRRGGWSLLNAGPLPWGADAGALSDVSARAAAQLITQATSGGQSWSIIWAAGAGVTSGTEAAFDAEFAALGAVFEGIERSVDVGAAGSVFFASSAGGVYAGSSHPPFTELTEPVAISPYGRFKLRGEDLVTTWAERTGIPSFVGRIANLYGAGQRLDKLQGLISHIALARLTAKPASIYVPLDTLRDYIVVDDCAALIVDGLERLGPEDHILKILGSGQATTISSLLGQFRLISRGRPRVVLGYSAAGAMQAHDLRLRSIVWPDLDRRRSTSLPAGIHATMNDILATIQRGSA